MLSNEIPRFAQLEDGSKTSSPRRPCPLFSQPASSTPGWNIGTKKGLGHVMRAHVGFYGYAKGCSILYMYYINISNHKNTNM